MLRLERMNAAGGSRDAALRLAFIALCTFLRSHLMADTQTNNWPDLLIGLYDNLTGRRAEITYEFDNMHIKIPSGTGPAADHAEWVLNGTMKIRTRDAGTHPN
jgi:hypothetical protein